MSQTKHICRLDMAHHTANSQTKGLEKLQEAPKNTNGVTGVEKKKKNLEGGLRKNRDGDTGKYVAKVEKHANP